ncbi:T9SS type A sorting domain-containing protein [Nubsella zeaxanthinifaciens]|uniref:T9SS type A sorting domain-containing protein n=1 Tax=Nubsella zeaxanthinifaciens TaxID=392412 RepID=UPI000DE535CF|nr:T9SS type A sorting domain-containing protein [Nubsella zeaxanthinifaciens]
MKKLLLFFSLSISVVIAKGQSLSQLWYYEATTTPTELLTTTSATYSLAYNKVTNKLYVANRGDQIYIVDPESYTGNISSIPKSSLLALNKGTIAETYCFSKVRVDDNGVIYATAMQTNGIIYIYRWASETAAPTRYTFTDATITSRVGDSFGLFGTGDNTRLYVAGNSVSGSSTGSKLYVFDVIGGVPTYHGAVDLDAAQYNATFRDVAKGSISAEAADVLWLGSTDAGVTFRRVKINLTTNTYVSHEVISSTYANFNATVGEYVNENGKGYFAVTSGKTIANQNLVQLSKTGNVGDASVTMQNVSSFNFGKTAYTTNSGYADMAVKRNADNTTTFFVVTSQNYIGAVKTFAPLPVTLTSFDASLVKGQSTLTWGTAAETNNKGFELYRATEGTDFKKIDFIAAKSSNGNSATALTYTYVDRTAKAGVNYYKLKQLDLDGKSETFEKVVSVDVKLSTANVVVYPNPATSYVNVNLADDDYKNVKYDLFDLTGKKVLSEVAKASQQDVSVAALPAGVYYLKITKNGAEIKTAKIIKQ